MIYCENIIDVVFLNYKKSHIVCTSTFTSLKKIVDK